MRGTAKKLGTTKRESQAIEFLRNFLQQRIKAHIVVLQICNITSNVLLLQRCLLQLPYFSTRMLKYTVDFGSHLEACLSKCPHALVVRAMEQRD